MSEDKVVENVENNESSSNESPFKFIQEHPDRYLWALGVIPIAGAILELILGIPAVFSIFVYIIPNILFSIMDEKELKKTNRVAPAHWTVFVVPVYIWQRLKLNNQDKKIFWGWIVAFLISAMITGAMDEGAIEDSACNLVTEIIQEQFNRDVQCVAVTIDDEVKSDFYRATATLDTGKDIDITIDTRKDDEIYVQIMN